MQVGYTGECGDEANRMCVCVDTTAPSSFITEAAGGSVGLTVQIVFI